MKLLFFVAALTVAAYAEKSNEHTPPKVQVYSQRPGEIGKKNVLICHVSGFHPPDISIKIFNGQDEMTGGNQTDLAFKSDWRFHLTRSVDFTPSSGQQYSCVVKHGSQDPKNYVWNPDM